MKGHLYIPDDYDGRKLSGVVVCHPSGGVKEQTAGRYAEELSKKGFAALAFDAARQGESEGEPGCLEDPFQRAEDIRSAMTYLSTRNFMDENKVGILGVCAGGSYVSYTAQTDRRMKAVATIDAVKQAGDNAELYTIDGASHMDLYYKDHYVDLAVEKLTDFYTKNLG